jgi:glucose/arabinose dehydrogenase
MVQGGGDELNIVEKGKNYGWPVITYGINYDGTTITELKEKERYGAACALLGTINRSVRIDNGYQ